MEPTGSVQNLKVLYYVLRFYRVLEGSEQMSVSQTEGVCFVLPYGCCGDVVL